MPDSLFEQLSNRIRNLETAENPIVYNVATSNVSSPPTQVQTNTAFGATAAQVRDGWSGVIYDNVDALAWLATSINDSWWFVNISTGGVGPHTILDATIHTDTVTQAVTAGALIYGNATPKWDKTTHITWSETNDLLTITPQAAGGLYFAGADTFNKIYIPDNVANALEILDNNSAAGGSPTYIKFTSTDGSQVITVGVSILPDIGLSYNIGASSTRFSSIYSNYVYAATGFFIRNLAGTNTHSLGPSGLTAITGHMNITTTASGNTIQLQRRTTVTNGTAPNQSFVILNPAGHANNSIEVLNSTPATIMCVDENGWIAVGNSNPDVRIHAEAATALTNTIIDMLKLTHTTSGVSTAGFGIGFQWELESTTSDRIAATDEALWISATDATRSAARRFEVLSNTNDWEFLRLSGSATQAESVFNEDQIDIDFRVESDNNANAIYVDAGQDRNAMFTTTLNARLTISQGSTTAAIPVDWLIQSDVDEPFTGYQGTASAADLTRSLVDNGDVGSATLVGWIKVEIKDDGSVINDGDYYVPFYTLSAP